MTCRKSLLLLVLLLCVLALPSWADSGSEAQGWEESRITPLPSIEDSLTGLDEISRMLDELANLSEKELESLRTRLLTVQEDLRTASLALEDSAQSLSKYEDLLRQSANMLKLLERRILRLKLWAIGSTGLSILLFLMLLL